MKSTVLPQAEAKGSTRNMLATLGVHMRLRRKFLTSVFVT
jgi:hypothetical protein